MKKKITFEFNNEFHKNEPVELGLKFVLWEIIIPKEDSEIPIIKHDWGFALWQGVSKGWEPMDVPEGWAANVVWWANTVDPDLLLKVESKIIGLGGIK